MRNSHPTQSFYVSRYYQVRWLRSELKKLCSNSMHSSSIIPPITSGALSNPELKSLITESHAPSFALYAPKNSLRMRELRIAPAHIAHGSSGHVQGRSRQASIFSVLTRLVYRDQFLHDTESSLILHVCAALRHNFSITHNYCADGTSPAEDA